MEGQNNERKLSNMKNRNNQLAAVLFVVGLALAPIVQAVDAPQGENLPAIPAITIHSTDDVTRGKTGSFVLEMKPRLMFGGTWVNFSVSGTAVPGVDYVPLVSPAYIGQSGYAVILVQTLPDPRASSNRQSYSVVITLEAGLGYAIGQPSSATMWIKP